VLAENGRLNPLRECAFSAHDYFGPLISLAAPAVHRWGRFHCGVPASPLEPIWARKGWSLGMGLSEGPMLHQIAGDPHLIGGVFGFAFGGLFGYAVRSMISLHRRQTYRRRRG